MARKAPPRIAIVVATRCPAIAPLATPHGDCRRGEEEGAAGGTSYGLYIVKCGSVILLFRNLKNHTCAAPRAIVASIERSPHS